MMANPNRTLPAGDGADNEEGLGPGGDRVWQGSVGRVVRHVFLARIESDEGTALLRDVVADRPAQHRVLRLQRVQDRALRDWAGDLDPHLAAGAGERLKMCR